MQATIISDTSCLILLDRIKELHLLQKLFGHVVITSIIEEEFGQLLPNWVKVQNPINQVSQMVLETTVDKGEASAIALALEIKDCLLIVDELKGRKLATSLGLTITGTLGILAQARQKGHIELLKPLLDKVKQTDFRLDESLEHAILKLVGE